MATLPKLPKCPKCGKEPEWWSYYAKGGSAWGISLMCKCKELQDSFALTDCRCVMRLNRIKWKLVRQWKEYVKESNNGSCSEDKN